jgi:hypothetical protein
MDFHDALLILRVCPVSSNLPANRAEIEITLKSLAFPKTA